MAFDPVSAAAGASLSVGDALINQGLGMRRQRQAQGFSADMFQKRYQMTVEDMKAAGLNPMLAYMQGAGGQPSSSAASVAGSEIQGGVNQTRLASAQEANINADTEKKAAEKDNITTDTLVKSGMPAKIAAETTLALKSAETAQAQAENYRAQITKLEQEVKTLKTQSEKNKSDTNLSNQLANSQQFLNALRQAETILTQAKSSNTWQEYDINEPKRRAADYWSAEAGERGKNMWNLFSPWK